MNNLKELRKQKGISQSQLARNINVSRSTICLYEKGKRQPDHEILSKMADYFGVSVDYLLGRTDNPQFSITAPETVTAAEYDLLQNYRALTADGKKLVYDLAEKLYDMLYPKQ